CRGGRRRSGHRAHRKRRTPTPPRRRRRWRRRAIERPAGQGLFPQGVPDTFPWLLPARENPTSSVVFAQTSLKGNKCAALTRNDATVVSVKCYARNSERRCG